MQAVVWLKVAGKKQYSNWRAGTITASKTKPNTSDREIAIKFTIDIPDEVFEEPVYEAEIKMPKVTRKLPEITEIAKKRKPGT